MRKQTTSQAGLFNTRVLVAVLLCLVGASLGFLSFASTPSNGILSEANPVLTYDAGPFNVPNESPLGLGQLDTGPRCNDNTFPCDSYALTVNLTAGYTAAHPNAAVKVTMFWTDTGAGQSDYDLYIYNGDVTTLDGSQPANYQSASGSNPEVATLSPLSDGTATYTIKIVPYTPTQETVHVRIELLPGTGGGGFPGFGGKDSTAPGKPRYQIFYAPSGSSAEPGSGEFNIGYNPQTGRIMVMNSGPIWRLTPGEKQTPAKPECCEALWEDRSAVTTNTGLDPILWTDQTSGRTFASNSTAGANAVYAYSDSDGEPSVTQPTGWTEFGVGAPNGGADHETIGSGPYPASLSFLVTPQNHGEAAYYCSQDIVGPAACYRSDTLGVSWGASTLAYDGTTTACGGLHGHVHVAPDGTVWLPVNQCGGNQGGALSTDGGTTWTEFIVPNSTSQVQGADPSIAIDSNNTVYYAYVRNEPVAVGNPPEGHARVAVGHRNANNTVTWTGDIDLGASHGIVNAAEIEAVGGSTGRAAVGFLGTDRSGDYQAIGFPGKWYAFISTTYDGGQTWTTVNATPNDPVQSMTGIWQQGGGATQRNLLDFNEITIDDKGRVLYGFSDGCVTPECVGGGAPNDFVAHMRVARQSGGKTVFASYDSNTDTTAALVPKPACLSGTRDAVSAHLIWKAPDNGGADIVSYQIWRGTTSGGETNVFTTNSPRTDFVDAVLNPNITGYDPNAPDYYYYVRAINSVGTGVQSNEIHLVAAAPEAVESVCVLPGLTKLFDPAGDTSAAVGIASTPAPPGADLLSFHLAQPFQNDGVPRLVFTINTDANPTGTGVPGSAWYVAMRIVNGANTTYKGIHMAFTNPTTPMFESYTPGANNSGGVDGRFVEAGSQVPADDGSNYDGANGKITIIVKASDLGLNPGDTIAGFLSGVSQSSDPGNIGAGVTALYDQMPDSLSFANSYTVGFNNICAATSPGVVSRKTHGSAGVFDINLPPTGNAGIECRNGGANNAHTLVFTFGTNLGFAGSASVMQGSANVTRTSVGPNLNQVTVELSSVPNAQHLTIQLNGAQDSGHVALSSVSARMDVLLGDTGGDGAVNSTDVSQTKLQSGMPVSSSNFRTDVIANGAINATDAATVKLQSGTALPPGQAHSNTMPGKR